MNIFEFALYDLQLQRSKIQHSKTKLKIFVFIEFTPDADYCVSLSVNLAIADIN